jgi:RecB family exonuclease
VRLWAREEAIDEQLARELAAGEARALRGRDQTWDALIDACARLAGARPLDPLVARLALREACAVGLAGTPWAQVAAAPGLAAAAERFIDACERAEVDARTLAHALAQAGGEVEAAARERLDRLTRVLAAWERLVGPVGASRGARQAAARRHLAGGGALPLEAGARVEVAPRIGWELADVALTAALAARLGAGGGGVRVHLPYRPDQPALFAGLEPVIAAFEANVDLAALELELDADAAEAPPAVRAALAAVGRGEAEAPPPDARDALRLVSAANETAERRAVAAAARALVDAGVAPEAIGVASRQPEAVADELRDELERVGLRLDDRRGEPLASAPPFRLALALLALADEGFAREDVLAVLGSRFVAPCKDLARRARALGLTELGREGRARLAAKHPEVAETCARALAPIEALPDAGTLAEHAAALAAALAALEVPRRARRYDPGPAPDAPTADPAAPDDARLQARLDRALARDQAAMDALDELLDELPRAAARLGLARRRLARADFAALLEDLAAATRLRPLGARGGAVRLVHLRDLAGRAFEHVFVVGLVEGQAPATGGDDGVFGARERRAVDRVLGRRAMGVGGSEDERTPYEGLMLWTALAAARRQVTLSWARHAGGRPTARSPFVDEIARAAPWLVVAALPAGPVVEAHAARAAGDLMARAALELWADPELRLPGEHAAPPAALAMYQALVRRLPARVERVAALARVERERWRGAGTRRASPFAGLAAGAAGLAARVGGGADAPLSAGALEKHANCPFTFFAQRVLGVGEPDEAGAAPEAKDLGTLAHEVMQRFYQRRRDAGALPVVPDDAARRELEAVIDEVAGAGEARRAGHPALWSIALRRLADQLWRLVEREAEAGGELLPAYFELTFPGDLPALRVGEGDAALFVSGRVDRVDIAPGGRALRVLDYKLGGADGHAAKLGKEVAGVTALQLPVYALAVRAGLAERGRVAGDAAVDAAFVSLRDGKLTRTLGERLGAAALDTLLDAELPERLARAAASLRAGEFPVAPVECRGCTYRTVCRVVALELEDPDA